jgi:hypothetical protein
VTDQLTAALIAAQKLEKKLRQLRNHKEATDEDVDDAKEAVAILREIADRHEIITVDIDRVRRNRHKG